MKPNTFLELPAYERVYVCMCVCAWLTGRGSPSLRCSLPCYCLAGNMRRTQWWRWLRCHSNLDNTKRHKSTWMASLTSFHYWWDFSFNQCSLQSLIALLLFHSVLYLSANLLLFCPSRVFLGLMLFPFLFFRRIHEQIWCHSRQERLLSKPQSFKDHIHCWLTDVSCSHRTAARSKANWENSSKRFSCHSQPGAQSHTFLSVYHVLFQDRRPELEFYDGNM